MAAITGITGAVTSWAGTQNTQLIATGSEPASFTLDVDGDEFDTTTFATTGAETALKGLYSWGGEITQQFKTAQIGSAGSVVFSAGYVTNLNNWELVVTGTEYETTAFGSLTAKTFIPGTFRWGGTFGGFLDDTTVATLPGNSNEPATGTFRLRDLATDDDLSGSIFTTRLGASSSPLAVNTVSYSFRGSGALTQSTPTSGTTIFPLGALAAAASGSLVLTASTGRTYTGDAFWTGITVTVPATNLCTTRIRFRGAGALTPA